MLKIINNYINLVIFESYMEIINTNNDVKSLTKI